MEEHNEPEVKRYTFNFSKIIIEYNDVKMTVDAYSEEEARKDVEDWFQNSNVDEIISVSNAQHLWCDIESEEIELIDVKEYRYIDPNQLELPIING